MKDPKPMFGDPIGPWRPWFAWYPVRSYDGVLLWLCKVGRRRIQKHDYLIGGEPLAQWWQYAPFGDLQSAAVEQVQREGRVLAK